jgi:putative redox protein
MPVRIDITYNDHLRCAAVHEPSGQILTTDAPVDNQGRGQSFSPTDLIATAFGTCLATVMGIVAEQELVDLSGMKITVLKDMVNDPKRRIGKLCALVEFPRALTSGTKARLERAARLCPVRESLRADIDLIIEFVYP